MTSLFASACVRSQWAPLSCSAVRLMSRLRTSVRSKPGLNGQLVLVSLGLQQPGRRWLRHGQLSVITTNQQPNRPSTVLTAQPLELLPYVADMQLPCLCPCKQCLIGSVCCCLALPHRCPVILLPLHRSTWRQLDQPISRHPDRAAMRHCGHVVCG